MTLARTARGAAAPDVTPLWVGHKGPLGRNAAWTNEAFPGIAIRHCGHPTALRPYHVVANLCGSPLAPIVRRAMACHLSWRTFPRLADAQQAVADGVIARLEAERRARQDTGLDQDQRAASLTFSGGFLKEPWAKDGAASSLPVVGVNLPGHSYRLPLRLDLRDVGIDQFAWGGASPGSEQLALALAAEVVGPERAMAGHLYIRVMERLVLGLRPKEPWEATGTQILRILRDGEVD